MPSRPSSRQTTSRNRALAAVGGIVALGGLGLFLYNQYRSSTDQSATGAKDSSAAGPSSKAGKKNSARPSLSLSLPPNFERSPFTIRLLQSLLAALSQHYIVTLIVPAPNISALLSEGSNDANGDATSLESVQQLSDVLGHVQDFDARRIVEYSKEEGRMTVSRALACDAHCEVMLQPCKDEAAVAFEKEDGALFDDEDEDDGERTPRASSPALGMRASNGASSLPQSDAAITTALERYHAEVARLRKSSGLLIFLLLPMPDLARRANGAASHSRTDDSRIWSLEIESILKPFLMPGQRDLSSRVPGVKVIDERLPPTVSSARHANGDKVVSPSERSWIEAGQRVGSFARGWS